MSSGSGANIEHTSFQLKYCGWISHFVKEKTKNMDSSERNWLARLTFNAYLKFATYISFFQSSQVLSNAQAWLSLYPAYIVFSQLQRCKLFGAGQESNARIPNYTRLWNAYNDSGFWNVTTLTFKKWIHIPPFPQTWKPEIFHFNSLGYQGLYIYLSTG